MKYIIIIMILCLSCVLPMNYETDNPCLGMTEDDIGEWIKINLIYKFDPDNVWKSPKEILNDMTGDCEEYCVLYIWMMYINYGCEYSLVFVYNEDKGHHGLVLIDGKLFEPQMNRESQFYTFDDIYRTESFLDLFNSVTYWGTKSFNSLHPTKTNLL